MTSFNQSDLFVVKVVDQIERDTTVGGWMLLVEVDNLGVEPNYFNQCLVDCYASDVSSSVSGNRIVFNYAEKSPEEEYEVFCEGVAKEILKELKKHPQWGEKDGPDLKRNYDNLD